MGNLRPALSLTLTHEARMSLTTQQQGFAAAGPSDLDADKKQEGPAAELGQCGARSLAGQTPQGLPTQLCAGCPEVYCEAALLHWPTNAGWLCQILCTSEQVKQSTGAPTVQRKPYVDVLAEDPCRCIAACRHWGRGTASEATCRAVILEHKLCQCSGCVSVFHDVKREHAPCQNFGSASKAHDTEQGVTRV